MRNVDKRKLRRWIRHYQIKWHVSYDEAVELAYKSLRRSKKKEKYRRKASRI